MAANEARTDLRANPEKAAKVAGAVASLNKQGWTWFGLASEGGNKRNEMSICNRTRHSIELAKIYIHWGKVKIPPEPIIHSMEQDECLFHSAGSWATAGSSGIVTYKLQHGTNLHIMWDCPSSFNFSDNFIGLMLSSYHHIPNKCVFKRMYQDWEGDDETAMIPMAESTYDLVCCGPSRGNSKETGGKGPWGHLRPCKVRDEHYEVYATMGDRHATSSKITVMEVSEVSK